MSLNAPPWGGPAVTRAAGGGSGLQALTANHWKRRDAKPEAKGLNPP